LYQNAIRKEAEAMNEYYAQLQAATAVVAGRIRRPPRLAIVLGSGLGLLADEVADGVSIPYAEIPHFPVSTAPGHAGRMVAGSFQGVPVAMMAGRVHLYEGYSAGQVVFPVRLLRELGVETLIVTNAAGGVNPRFSSGALMLITDHINLTGHNPLVGPNDDRFGTRFPDMTEAYSLELRMLAESAAVKTGVPLEEGIYLGLLGPTYETPAEVRMVRMLGGDAVGMSTVLEVIAANHLGMQVLGISCITNMAAGMLPQKLHHEEVMETASRVSGQFAALLRSVVAGYGSA
jgi:purine-nucleoside phosphorylase